MKSLKTEWIKSMIFFIINTLFFILGGVAAPLLFVKLIKAATEFFGLV